MLLDVKPVVTMINIIVISAHQDMCTTISHQLNNSVEWINAKQIIKKKVVTNVSPAEISQLIMKKLLTAIVMKVTTNKRIMNAELVLKVVLFVLIMANLAVLLVILRTFSIICRIIKNIVT